MFNMEGSGRSRYGGCTFVTPCHCCRLLLLKFDCLVAILWNWNWYDDSDNVL